MSNSKHTRLPKEAIKFAKQMGISLDGLEPEAEDIWKMLDDLSSRDPSQYQNFIAEQLRQGAEEGDDSNRRSFRPDGTYAWSCLVIVRAVSSMADFVCLCFVSFCCNQLVSLLKLKLPWTVILSKFRK